MIIGITGGIGSGKSVISRELRHMGYQVYDTDSEAKRLINEDPQVKAQIIQLFGPAVYKDGVYQTHLVAAQVFENQSLLSQLNAIVHPAVRADILSRSKSLADASEQAQGNIFFIECAILYTAHLDTICDKVVAVTAPEEVRLNRVIARDNTTIEKVRARMHAQQTESDLQRADITINNDSLTPISELCQLLFSQLH